MPVPPPGAPPHRTDPPTAPAGPPLRPGRTDASGDDRAFWRGETFWRDGELLTAEAGGTGREVLERARQQLARPLVALTARTALAGRTGARTGAPAAWAGAPVRWAATGVAGAALTAFAILIVSGRVVTEGPVLLVLSATHGVHAGDLGVLLAWAAAETALVVAALHGGTARRDEAAQPGASALQADAPAVTATQPAPAQEAPLPATTTAAPAAPVALAVAAAADPPAPEADPVRRRSWAARTALSGERPLRRDVDPEALRDELDAAVPAPRAPEGARV